MKLNNKQKYKILSRFDIYRFIYRDPPLIEGIRNAEFSKLFKDLVKAKEKLADFCNMRGLVNLIEEYRYIACNPYRSDSEDEKLSILKKEILMYELEGIDLQTVPRKKFVRS